MNVKKTNWILKNCEDKLEQVVVETIDLTTNKINEIDSIKSAKEWAESVNEFFANTTKDDDDEVQEGFNRLIEQIILINRDYLDNVVSTATSIHTTIIDEMTRRMDDIYERCVREVGLANGNRMTRTEINKVCYRLKQLERKIDNLALMIVDISNEILEQTEQSMVNNTQALLNYNGGKYWKEILDAISELQQEKCDEVKEKRLRITSRRELEELVSANGFVFQRQSGSHRIYASQDGNITIIPQHGKTVSSGVGYAVQKQIKK